MAKLNKSEIKEFIETIKWSMQNITVDSEEKMNDFSTLSTTLLRACNDIVEISDLLSVEDVIVRMKRSGDI